MKRKISVTATVLMLANSILLCGVGMLSVQASTVNSSAPSNPSLYIIQGHTANYRLATTGETDGAWILARANVETGIGGTGNRKRTGGIGGTGNSSPEVPDITNIPDIPEVPDDVLPEVPEVPDNIIFDNGEVIPDIPDQ